MVDQVELRTDEPFNHAAFLELAYRAGHERECFDIIDELEYKPTMDTDPDINMWAVIRHNTSAPIFEDIDISDYGMKSVCVSRVFTEAEWISLLQKQAQLKYNKKAFTDLGNLKTKWANISEDEWIANHALKPKNVEKVLQSVTMSNPVRYPEANRDSRSITKVEIFLEPQLKYYKYVVVNSHYYLVGE